MKDQKERALKLFNGRGHGGKDRPELGRGHHFYIAAYSAADAERVLTEVLGYGNWKNEIRVYYHHDAWGTNMAGVTPERGLWAIKEPVGKPFRLLPLTSVSKRADANSRTSHARVGTLRKC